MQQLRPEIIAQPTADHDWEVRGGCWERDGEGHIMGFIAEIGGVYEVESLTGSRTREYCASFKEAMAWFEPEA